MSQPVNEVEERPRDLDDGESEAVTVAFSDASADVCGIARVGRARVDGELRTSGLALLFHHGEVVAVRAEGGEPVPDQGAWGDVAVAGVDTVLTEPLRAWTVSFASADGRYGFDLDLEAVSGPARLEAGMPAGRLGGMEGYDQLVRVVGSVTIDGADRRFEGRGQRGHSWGTPDWGTLSAARTIGVWLDGDGGVAVTALRPSRAAAHGDEVIHAMLLGDVPIPVADDAPVTASEGIVVADPRISTTYDGTGHQRAAGLELYVREDDPFPLLVTGEVACGTTLDLGRQRLECAFFRWRLGDRDGVGRYDLLTTTTLG